MRIHSINLQHHIADTEPVNIIFFIINTTDNQRIIDHLHPEIRTIRAKQHGIDCGRKRSMCVAQMIHQAVNGFPVTYFIICRNEIRN